MEKKVFKKGDRVQAWRGGPWGGPWINTTVIKVRYDKKIDKWYYYLKCSGPGMGYPVAHVRRPI